MQVPDAAIVRRFDAAAEGLPAELVPVDVLDAVAALQPVLDRVRRGEWRVLITGPRTSAERKAAVLFHAKLLDLADALEARR